MQFVFMMFKYFQMAKLQGQCEALLHGRKLREKGDTEGKTFYEKNWYASGICISY